MICIERFLSLVCLLYDLLLCKRESQDEPRIRQNALAKNINHSPDIQERREGAEGELAEGMWVRE